MLETAFNTIEMTGFENKQKRLYQSSPEQIMSKVNTPHIRVQTNPHHQPQNDTCQQPLMITKLDLRRLKWMGW